MSAKGIHGVHQHLERLASELRGVYGGYSGRTIRCWIVRRGCRNGKIGGRGGTRGCILIAVRIERTDEHVNHAKHGWCIARLGRRGGVRSGSGIGSLKQNE
jgi:hypothetical protein